MKAPLQKLELTWIGKENRPKLEPRILLEDAEKSYHAPHRVTENDIFDNPGFSNPVSQNSFDPRMHRLGVGELVFADIG